ncbi:uncharacterized protein [Battus philenor]|uniref:uncharacterized protein isoform X3 n=1 Tax=Battus philenor TaxID=42288 RepID=UPI0035D036C6
MWRVFYFILCVVPASRQISITEFIVPRAVQAGENAELHCRYDLDAGESDKGLYVKWWWTPLNATSDQMHQLYQRIIGHDPVIIHSTIRLAMGSGPQLNISTTVDGPDDDENEDVMITCEATGVAPYPDISIAVDGDLLSNASENVEGPFEGMYDITTSANVTKSTVDGAEIRCELFFKNDNISHPAYVVSEIFNISGGELSTTEAPENSTAPEVVFDSLQNINGGEKIGICMSLVIGLLLSVVCNIDATLFLSM